MRRNGIAGRQQHGGQAAGKHRLALTEGLLVQEGGSQGRLARVQLGHAGVARSVVIGQQQEPGRLRREGEVTVGQRAVVLQRGLMQRREHRIEWMLDHAGVPAGGTGADLRRLDQEHRRPALGGEGRRGAADDPAADDEQVRNGHALPLGFVERGNARFVTLAGPGTGPDS